MDSRTNTLNRITEIEQNGLELSTGQMISEGWELFKKNAGMYIGYTILYLAVSMVVGSILNLFGQNAIVSSVGRVVVNLLQMILGFGFFCVAHYSYNNRENSFANFFDGFQYAGKLIVSSIVTGSIVVLLILPGALIAVYMIFGGDFSSVSDQQAIIDRVQSNPSTTLLAMLIFFVLALPAIYVQLGFSFTPLLYIFSNLNIGEAMKYSFKMVNKKIGVFILYGLALMGLLILALIPCGLGIIVCATS